MTDPRRLLAVEPAESFLIFADTEKACADALLGWLDAGLTARLVRGRKMRTVDGLFDEMAAALQFPYYFGENWPAFDECLSDMDWLPMQSGIVIAVADSAEVLADAPAAELPVLVRLIKTAAQTYSEPIEAGQWWDRPTVPFHVVLQTRPDLAAAVRIRWQAAGATIAEL